MEENKKEILLKKLENINEIIKKEANEKNYFKRGAIYEKLKNYNKAIEDYTNVIELVPECILAYKKRGECNINLKKYKEAIEDYDKAIELN